MNIYDFKVKKMDGEEISLSEYKGKVLLIVNTATKCGFTPQYEGLQALHEKYAEQGLVILDFPCNQFLNQAPGSDEEIKNFCVSEYSLSYEPFSKIEVNGKNAHPLYQFLKEEKPQDKKNLHSNGFLDKLQSLGQALTGSAIRWNFTKFLVDREGRVVERYSPTFDPQDLAQDIEALL